MHPQPRGNGFWVLGILLRIHNRVSYPAHFEGEVSENLARSEFETTGEKIAVRYTVSHVTSFKQAKAGRIPSFRIGTCVALTHERWRIGYVECEGGFLV